MIWHVLAEGTEYAYARPALTAMNCAKQRSEPALCARMAKAGPGRDYCIKEIREREAGDVRRAEQATSE